MKTTARNFATYFLMLLLLLLINGAKVNAQGGAPSVAALPPVFSLGNDIVGAAANSVNLFTGEVSLPIQLAAVSGRGGLNAGVSIAYSSAGVRNSFDVWNLDSPTGILGLGWTLDCPKIIVDNKQTGTREDDEFFLVQGGGSNKLIRTKGTSTAKEYKTQNYTFWKIIYYPNSEKWEITHEDGTKYIYGDKNSNRHTVQWIVKWGNWIGSSSRTSGQQQQASAWNLAEIINLQGDKLLYEYEVVEQYVGSSSGKKYTEASYPKTITTPTGGKVEFFYGSKLISEFQDPHTEKSEPDAYQERYEKKYLDYITIRSDYGRLLKKVKIGYNTSTISNPRKRLLTSITEENEWGETRPGTTFSYLNSGTSKGCLQKVTNGMGGNVTYTYSNGIQIAHSDRKSLKIAPPVGYGEPSITQGPDFVLIMWRQLNSNGSHDSGARPVKIYVYTWEGEWIEKYLTTVGAVETETNQAPYIKKNFQIRIGKDFIGLLDKTSGNTHRLYRWIRDGKKQGEWIASTSLINLGAQEHNDHMLMSGDNYLAVHTQRDGEIFTYVRDGNTWRSKTIYQYSGRYDYGFGNNWIVSHQRTGGDHLWLHYLNEQRQWVRKFIPFVPDADWNNPSYWHGSNSFLVAMKDNSTEHIYWWNENFDFNSFKQYDIGTFDDHAFVNTVNNSLVAVVQNTLGQGKALRFDGVSWVSSGLKSISNQNVSNTAQYYSFGNDMFLRGALNIYRTIFNPNTLSWTDNYLGKYSSYDHTYFSNPARPSTGLNAYSYDSGVHYRNTNGSWTNLFSPYIAPSDADPYAGGLNQSGYHHASLGFPNFVVYHRNLGSNYNGQRGMVRHIKNGTYTSQQDILDRSVFEIGLNTVGSYNLDNGLKNYWLHRIVKGTSLGKQTFYPVTKITVNDGYENKYTSFDYTTATATVDASGTAAQFNKVRTIAGSSTISSKPYGYTDTYFYNGLTSSEASLAHPFGMDSYYNMLKGAVYATKVYNSTGAEVSSANNNTAVFYKELYNGSNEKVGRGYYTRPSSSVTMADGLTTSTHTYYDTNTGLPTKTTTYIANSKGGNDNHVTENKYWWEAYDTDRSDHIFTRVIQTTKKVNNVVKDVAVSKWKNWTFGWAPSESYVWKGTGSSAFTWWTSTPNSNWQKASEVIARDAQLNVTETKDMDGMYSTTVWGNKQTVPIGSFTNARKNEVLIEDFDDGNAQDYYPNYFQGSGWNTSSSYLKRSNNTGNGYYAVNRANWSSNFIAEFEVKIPKSASNSGYVGFQFNKNAYSHAPTNSGYTIKFFPNNTVQLYKAGGTVLASSTLTNPISNWHRVRIVKEGSSIKVYIDGVKRLTATNAQYSGGYLGFYADHSFAMFDNLRAYPNDAYASSTAYDKDFKYPKASIDASYEIARGMVDGIGRTVAALDSKGIPLSTASSSPSRWRNASFVSTDPNVALQTAVRGRDGFSDDFNRGVSGEWQKVDRSNGHTATWTNTNNTLVFVDQGGNTGWNSDSYMLDFGREFKGRIGVELDVKKVGASSSGWNFGVGLGGDAWSGANGGSENAIWTAMNGNTSWRTFDGSWKIISNANTLATNQTHRLKIIIDTDTKKADYYVDGKLLKSNVNFRSTTTGIQKLALFGYGQSAATWHIDNVVVYTDPVHSVVYSDAMGKVRQAQSEEPGNQIMVSEPVYDALNRAAVQTKATRINARFGYRTGYVTSFNWTTGAMAGAVKNNNAADGNYPYSRTKFDNSPLSRALESGAPGTTYRIGQKTTKVSYHNNTTAGIDFGDKYPANKYAVTKSINADGGIAYSMTDMAGNEIKKMAGTVKGNKFLPTSTDISIFATGTKQFTAAADEAVSYAVVAGKILKIGTSPGSSNIVYKSNFTDATFNVTKGTTYYITLENKPVIPDPDPDPDPDDPDLPDPCRTTDAVGKVVPCDIQRLGEQKVGAFTLTYTSGFTFTPNQDIYLTTSYEYDDDGNLTKIYPPNYHNPPTATAFIEKYMTSMTYDHFGRLKTKHTPDAGTMKYIYDKTGRLRFMQDSKGATGTQYILYWKYDTFGRTTEEGYYNYNWSEATLQTNAENKTWPSTPATWRKKYTYETFGTDNQLDRGALTKVETNNDASNDTEVTSYYNFDAEGNMISKGTKVADYESDINYINYKHDYNGTVTEVDYGNGIDPITYAYDINGRATSIGTAADPDKFASYTYDKNGALYQEKLNNNGVTRTHTYTSTGQLKQIDGKFVKETLSYESGGYGGYGSNTGLISKATFDFKGGHTYQNEDYTVAYQYDKVGRLQAADNSRSGNWDLGVGTGNLITYDANGNITKLKRGVDPIKNYKYIANTNCVQNTNGSTANQYVYDAIGNVTKSTNRGLDDIVYDKYFNLTTKMTRSDGYTTFQYGAGGERVLKKEYTGTSLTRSTFYIRGANDYPVLEKIKEGNQEGLKAYVYGPTGMIASTIMGSVGGNRTSNITITMEQEQAATEDSLFSGLAETRVVSTAANHTVLGNEALRLMPNSQINPSITIKVNRGDIFALDVWAYYEDAASSSNPDAAITAGATGATTITTGGEALSTTATNPIAALALMAMSRDKNRQPAAYLNYLLFDDDMKLLDGGYVGVSEAANFNKEALNTGQIKAKGSGVLYVYLSNEREDGKPVYYDDFSLSVTSTTQWNFYSKDHLGSTRVVFNESNQFESAMDYMPFGEMMREHNVGETAYQYTGQEYDKESGIHNYRARLYDSDLGRFYGMDPAEQFASPFSYAGNNPVMMTDPTGEEAITLGVVLIAAAISAASYTTSVALSDGGFDNWDWGQFAISTAIGAATGAIAPGIGSSIAESGMSAFGKVATGVYAHGVIGGISGGITGGESGAYSGFAAGAFSSLAGSGLQAAGVQSTVGIVAGSALTGGISAELTGGDFWRGAGQGAIIGGLNHAAHKLQQEIKHPGKLNLKDASDNKIVKHLLKGIRYYRSVDKNIDLNGLFDCLENTCHLRPNGHFVGKNSYVVLERHVVKIDYWELPFHTSRFSDSNNRLTFKNYKYNTKYPGNTKWFIGWGDGGVGITTHRNNENIIRNYLGY